MTRNRRRCSAGRVSGLLLGYLENGLDEDSRAAVEEHLRVCAECRAELDALRSVLGRIEAHPEAFHPDESDLWRYVSEAADPDGSVAIHLEDCARCREDVQLLREFATPGADTEAAVAKMPKSLADRLEALHGRERDFSPARKPGPVGRLYDWMRAPLRAPALSLGTAAAVVLILVIAPAMWLTYKKTSHPAQTHFFEGATETGPRPGAALAPSVSGSGVPAGKRALINSIRRGARTLSKDGKLSAFPESKALDRSPEGEAASSVFPLPPPAPGLGAPLHKIKRQRTRGKPNAGKPFALEGDKRAAPEAVPEKAEAESERKASAGRNRSLKNESFSGGPAGSTSSVADESVKEDREISRKGEGAPVSQGSSTRALPDRSATSRRLIPVSVVIVDSSNRAVRWLKFKPRGIATTRYRFVDRDSGGRTGDAGAGGLGSLRKTRKAGYMIRIRVIDSGKTYNLDAELFDRRTEARLKGLRVAGAGREELRDRIDRLVRSLLDIP